ncbi:MAG TPA: type I methionyl aminopeptidase [Chryseosolibacter sp.]
MSITSQSELYGMQRISEVVGTTLQKMTQYAAPGMSTKALDDFGASILKAYGAKSAPFVTYGFPGWTCISVNKAAAHGIPSDKIILQEGDLVNIDVSAELNGFFADNGGSFVLGRDVHSHQRLVDSSRKILHKAIATIKGGMRIADIGWLIEREAKDHGYTTIRNLVGHGIGRSLHEEPKEIPCFNDRSNRTRFRKNSVVAIETFISTKANYVYETDNGWTYTTRDGSYVAQHEHTILITDTTPVILTSSNGI